MKKYLTSIIVSLFFLPLISYGITATSTATDDDGYGVVGQLGGSYTTALDLESANSYTTTGNWIEIQNHLNSGYWQPARAIIPFDTSNIPVGSTITSAKLRIRMGSDKYNTNGTSLVITAVDIDYYDNVNDFNKNHYSTEFGSETFSNLSENTWEEITLSENFYEYFTGEGITPIGIRTKLDIDRSEPTGLNSMQVGTSEVGYPAELIIEYTYTEEATSTATSTASLGDIAFGQAILITLISLGLVGFTFNTLNKKK